MEKSIQTTSPSTPRGCVDAGFHKYFKLRLAASKFI